METPKIFSLKRVRKLHIGNEKIVDIKMSIKICLCSKLEENYTRYLVLLLLEGFIISATVIVERLQKVSFKKLSVGRMLKGSLNAKILAAKRLGERNSKCIRRDG
jgi:hypothetical protein